MSPLTVLLIALGAFTVFYVVVLVAGIKTAHAPGSPPQTGVKPTGLDLLIGAVTNFFDTLGIGSFAPTTSMFRYWKTVPDERIPGTLNVGHTLPTIVEAFIYITIIQVEFQTLGLLIGAAMIGSWLGAGVVAKWPRRKIQIGMGYVLFAAALLFILKNIDEMRGTPTFPGGTALGLHGSILVVGVVVFVILGALMTLGIGLYAPCMIMIPFLGMSPKSAFPIMMGACAFLMPISSARFIKEKSFDLRASIGLLVGGIPAVLLAAFIVKEMNVIYVRWLVVVVVLYTSITMLRTAKREKAQSSTP